MIRRLFSPKFKSYISHQREPFLYSIGGGKGGIGKSFLTSNLAILFAKSGSKTLLVDLDFGGANSHTYLEVKKLKHSAFDYLSGNVKDVNQVIQPTQFTNLHIVTAQGEWFKSDENLYSKVPQLIEKLKALNFDRIFLDLGAGTNPETMSGYLNSDFKLTLATPEPTSIENTYFFLKKAFYNHLTAVSERHGFSNHINTVLEKKEKYGVRNPAQLLRHIETEYGKTGQRLVREFSELKPYFILNQCRSPLDYKLGQSLSQISRNYFGITAVTIGHLGYDNRVWQSVRSMKPLILDYPNCEIIKELEIVHKSLKNIEKTQRREYAIAS